MSGTPAKKKVSKGPRASQQEGRMDKVLETVVPPRMAGEVPIKVKLHAPGQRGILQSVVDVRHGAELLLPTYGETVRRGRILLKGDKSRARNERVLQRSLRTAKSALTDVILAIPEQALDKKAFGCLLFLSKAVDKALEAQRALQEMSASSGDLRGVLKEAKGCVKSFTQELSRITSVGESWMDVSWTANNSTAVGRGPPGFIAYSPFAQCEQPYDAAEVKRVIEDSNRRAR